MLDVRPSGWSGYLLTFVARVDLAWFLGLTPIRNALLVKDQRLTNLTLPIAAAEFAALFLGVLLRSPVGTVAVLSAGVLCLFGFVCHRVTSRPLLTCGGNLSASLSGCLGTI